MKTPSPRQSVNKKEPSRGPSGNGSTPPVFEVEIFLTNRCNLACSYCSSRHLRDDTQAQKLTFPQLKRFVDLVAADKTIKARFPGPVFIEFAGGEPMMEFELIKRTVDYIRARKLNFDISIATNGTLLTPARIDYLAGRDVDIRVSLDGLKEVNDSHRVFAHDRNKSVFDAVMANLKTGFPSERHKARCNISPTLDPRNIGTLPALVRFFGRDLGVRKLRIGLEAFGTWNPGEIRRFRKALRELVAELLASLKPGAPAGEMETAFGEFPLRRDIRCYRDGPEPAVSTLALLYDGYFYPSPDFVVAPPPPEARYRVGDLERGIDFRKLDKIFDPILAGISRHCEHKSGPRSPVEGYYWGLVNKYSPGEIREVLRSTSEINRVFGEETDHYMRLHRVFKRLAAAPGFGDFPHPPKHRADKEIRSLRAEVRAGSDLVKLRAAADYLLYSPGDRKELVLCRPEGEELTAEVLEAMEGISFYALVKAGQLGKKLRLCSGVPGPAAGRAAKLAGEAL